MEPVGKRIVVAVDVSTSLSSVVPGTSISTAVAAAAITMVRQGESPMGSRRNSCTYGPETASVRELARCHILQIPLKLLS